MADVYAKVAAATEAILEAQRCDEYDVADYLRINVLRGVAVLSEHGDVAMLSGIIAFIDAREHMIITPQELAASIQLMRNEELVTYDAGKVYVTDRLRRMLPRSKEKKLAIARSADRRWRKILELRSTKR
jgi:hypothetical protein